MPIDCCAGWRHREHRRSRNQGRSASRELWDRNITITTRLVDTVSTPMLLKPWVRKVRSQARSLTASARRDRRLRHVRSRGEDARAQGDHRSLTAITNIARAPRDRAPKRNQPWLPKRQPRRRKSAEDVQGTAPTRNSRANLPRPQPASKPAPQDICRAGPNCSEAAALMHAKVDELALS